MSLFETLKFLIDRGKTAGLAEKVEKLYAGGKLTDDEYDELTALLVEQSDSQPAEV